MSELSGKIKGLIEQDKDISTIKAILTGEGFLEEEINDEFSAIKAVDTHLEHKKSKRSLSMNRELKEVFDRISYGFSAHQFINILFYQVAGSLFLLGLINGAKTVLSNICSGILHEHAKNYKSIKKAVVFSGLILALSFLSMAIAFFMGSVLLFSAGMIVAGISVVFYGDLYATVGEQGQSVVFLKKISYFGIVLSGTSLLVAGFLLQVYPQKGAYIILIISALALIFSTFYTWASIHEIQKTIVDKKSIFAQLKEQLIEFKEHSKLFLKDKIIAIMLITTALTSAVQAIGNSYYGLFIFSNLDDVGFGGYMNVAIIFLIAMISSFFGSFITQNNSREYGKLPMLVFGTLLMAIMPFTFYYNPQLMNIALAVLLGILGNSIAGVARGMLIFDRIREQHRKIYFRYTHSFITIPFVVLVPIGAVIAQIFGFRYLFLSLGITLTLVVMPLYFALILIHHNKEKV